MTDDCAYSKSQVFRAALRLIRVDRRYEVSEKDEASGYVLFEYPVDGTEQKSPGSIEVIEQRDRVLFVIQLPEMPEYHERMLADKLLEKLQADYGEPSLVQDKKEKKSKDKPTEDPEAPDAPGPDPKES